MATRVALVKQKVNHIAALFKILQWIHVAYRMISTEVLGIACVALQNLNPLRFGPSTYFSNLIYPFSPSFYLPPLNYSKWPTVPQLIYNEVPFPVIHSICLLTTHPSKFNSEINVSTLSQPS